MNAKIYQQFLKPKNLPTRNICGTILSFHRGQQSCRMVFARPCNRSEAKRIDTSKCGLSIIDRTNPVRVSEYHKMRSARRVLNAKIDSTLSVPHNSLCCIPVNLMRILRESRDNSYCKREVRTCMSQIQQTTNQLSKQRRIDMWRGETGRKANSSQKWSRGSFTINHAKSLK